MTFLKKLGQIILKGGQIVLGFAPLIEQGASLAGVAPAGIDHLSALFKTITDVEVFGTSLGLPGADKVRAAAPNVEQIVLDFLTAKGLKVDATQQAKLTAACTALGGNLADILNTVHPDSLVATSAAQ